MIQSSHLQFIGGKPQAIDSRQQCLRSTCMRKMNARRKKMIWNCVQSSVEDSVVDGKNDKGVIIVAGATGGVGQLVTAKLVSMGHQVRAVVRDMEKGRNLFGDEKNIELFKADAREKEQVKLLFEDLVDTGVSVVDATGTTAFPSSRWKDGGSPSSTSTIVKNIVDCSTEYNRKSGKFGRYIFLSSIGVERMSQFPFVILDLFGALKHKMISEEFIKLSGLPYIIFRPCRLTDGPYTSYDLNTLLKATSDNKKDVLLTNSDNLSQEETSRISLADACVMALSLNSIVNTTLSIANIDGKDGPGLDKEQWEVRINAAT